MERLLNDREKIQLSYSISLDLDKSGFIALRDEISSEHPLFPVFSEALERIGLSAVPGTLSDEELQTHSASFYKTIYAEEGDHCVMLQRRWDQVGDTFLKLADELFNCPYNGPMRFFAYPSVWRVYIQQPEQHAISFPLERDTHDQDEAFYVVVHELLHVFFFDFIGTTGLLADRSDVWDVSEIFNVLVLQQAQFADLYPRHSVVPYPQHKDIVRRLREVSSELRGAENIIRAICLYVDNARRAN